MSDHAQVHYAADVVVLRVTRSGVVEVLLITRGWDPYAGHLALPGGHVDTGENSRVAAARELWEETGVQVQPEELRLLGVYDDSDRDPRYRMVSAAYQVTVDGNVRTQAASDAAEAGWYRRTAVLRGLHGPMAFDHASILLDAGAER